jgi:hypothetical protein
MVTRVKTSIIYGASLGLLFVRVRVAWRFATFLNEGWRMVCVTRRNNNPLQFLVSSIDLIYFQHSPYLTYVLLKEVKMSHLSFHFKMIIPFLFSFAIISPRFNFFNITNKISNFSPSGIQHNVCLIKYISTKRHYNIS